MPLRKKPPPQRLPPPRAPGSQESRIVRLLTVELNHDEFIADADLVSLTLLLRRINLEGNESSFETLAIQTTHLTGFRPGFAEEPHTATL